MTSGSCRRAKAGVVVLVVGALCLDSSNVRSTFARHGHGHGCLLAREKLNALKGLDVDRETETGHAQLLILKDAALRLDGRLVFVGPPV